MRSLLFRYQLESSQWELVEEGVFLYIEDRLCLLMICMAKLVFWAKEAFGIGVRKGHKTLPGDEEPACQGLNTLFSLSLCHLS